MATFGLILIIYGVLCIVIGLMKPPFIWNMKKFKIMEKMMGKNGLRIFVLVWGAACVLVGVLIR